jgi:hypothetical protein
MWEAIERDEQFTRGRRGTLLFRVMRTAGRFKLGIPAAWLCGAVEAARLLVRQRASPFGVVVSNRPVAVFAGFGARAEEFLLREYEETTARDSEVMRIDQTDFARTGLAHARVADVWRSLAAAIVELRSGLAVLAQRHPGRAADFLTTAAMRAGEYAFALAWWKDLRRRRQITEACFLAPDVHAFAAISTGVRSIYLQHGLLSRTLWFPEFAEVRPLTRFERHYFSARLPAAVVRPSRGRPADSPPQRLPRLLIVSGERPGDEMMLAAPLIRHLSDRGFPVHVRLFRGEARSRFWETADMGVELSFVDGRDSFDQVLDDLQPAFVASWGSTGLVEALYRGIIPISVARPGDRSIDATVFPLVRCCLSWPRDQAIVDEVIASPSAYDATLRALRSGELAFEKDRIA